MRTARLLTKICNSVRTATTALESRLWRDMDAGAWNNREGLLHSACRIGSSVVIRARVALGSLAKWAVLAAMVAATFCCHNSSKEADATNILATTTTAATTTTHTHTKDRFGSFVVCSNLVHWKWMDLCFVDVGDWN